MNWRVYYDDLTHYEGPLEDALNIGVVFIVEPQSSRVIHNRNGYWIYTDDGILPIDNLDGLIDQVLHQLPRIKRIFQGRSMTNDQYWAYYDRVKAENP